MTDDSTNPAAPHSAPLSAQNTASDPASSSAPRPHKKRGRFGPRARMHPLTRKVLLEMLWEGKLSPPEMLRKLNMSAGVAHRLLNRRQFQAGLRGLLQLIDARRRLMHARSTQVAVTRLTALTGGEGETARKACVDLLALHEAPAPLSAANAKPPESAAPAEPVRDLAPLEQRIDDLLVRLAQEQDAPPSARPSARANR